MIPLKKGTKIVFKFRNDVRPKNSTIPPFGGRIVYYLKDGFYEILDDMSYKDQIHRSEFCLQHEHIFYKRKKKLR